MQSTIFIDYRGVLWAEKNHLNNILVPLGGSVLSPERSFETDEFFLNHKSSSHEVFLRDLSDKAKAFKMSERYPQGAEEMRRREGEENKIDSSHNSSFDDEEPIIEVFNIDL